MFLLIVVITTTKTSRKIDENSKYIIYLSNPKTYICYKQYSYDINCMHNIIHYYILGF